MVTMYTKRNACEVLLSQPDPLAAIEAQKEGRKYYLLTAYTPYAGEEMETYVSCCEESALYEACDELTQECANEWVDQHLDCWDEDGYDSYEDAREDYYAGCGCRCAEVPKEEYAKASFDDAIWIMRQGVEIHE